MPSKLYLIDDEKSILQELTVLFSAYSGKQGHPEYEIHTASDGLEAYCRILKNKEPFDVVITNLKMPKMDGIELLQRLHLHRPNMPVIIYSAIVDMHNIVDIIKEGAFDVVPKTENRNVLLEKVKKAIEHCQICWN